MTCAECQDLLLDLAYGELDAARAAEVEAHIAGCADCQRERAGIAGVRTLVAPLLKTEEPSAAMDEVILRAARDEAERMAAGVGPRKVAARAAGPRVVEVAAMFAKPQAAAPVDVRAKVEARPPAAPPRRRWLLRAAAAGSLAAAAGLVLVVNDSQRMKSARHGSVDEAAAPRVIHIRVPGEAPPAPAPKKAEAPPAPAPKKAEAPRAAPAVERENAELRAKVAELERTRAEASRRSRDEQPRRAVEHRPAAKDEAANGDAPKLLAVRPTEEKSAEQDSAPALAKEAAKPQPSPSPAPVAQPPPVAPVPRAAAPAPRAGAPAEPAGAEGFVVKQEMNDMRAEVSPPTVASLPRHEMKAKKGASKSVAIADEGLQEGLGGSRTGAAAGAGASNLRGGSADKQGFGSAAQLEARARAARHGGNYGEAALLYRQAAALHRRAAESGQQQVPSSNQAPALDVPAAPRRDATAQVVPQKTGPVSNDQFATGQASLMAAAWALAHAVECLAADAQTDEARRVYEDLLIHYSFAQGPIAAAARALRIASPQRPAAVMPNAAEQAPAEQRMDTPELPAARQR